ncbi:MAG TPA: hypothetical protein VM782_05725 [Stellaceae bacterium]|nr:hypothetical protein [Stellaceae bacterium]
MTMIDRMDDDLMEDLAEPEGPAYHRADDPGDLGEELGDFGDLGDDLVDAYDPGEDLGDDLADDAADEFDDAIAEALMADEADEFLGSVWKAVKKVAPIVSKVAPFLPIPGAGVIGKVADVVANAAEDEADEIDAIDGMIELADEADAIDAVAPVVAGLAIKKAIPTVSRLPHGTRKQLVKATAAATKHIARRHGPVAAAAAPAIVRHARKVAANRGLPATHLPHLVKRTAARVARSPGLVRRMANTSRRMRTAPGMGGAGIGMGHRRRRHQAYGGFGGYSYRGSSRGFGGGVRRRGMRARGWDGYGAPREYGWDSPRGYGAPREYGWDSPRGYGGYGLDRPRGFGGVGGSRSLSLNGPVRITIESM